MRLKKTVLTHDQYQAYCRFMLRYERGSLRIACVIGIIHTLIMLVIDYWRVEHFVFDLIYRMAITGVLAGVVLFSYSDRITVRSHIIVCLTTSSAILVLSFFMDMSAGMPAFFLPNFICLLFYVFNAGLGHPLKLKFSHTGLTFIGFMVYGLTVSPHQDLHLSQSFNVFINATISLLIGFLIEQYKRVNFVQRQKIEGLNEIKTKLIAVFSHDISSPLNNLLALLRLRTRAQLSEDELNQHTDKVEHSIENVLDMVKNLVRWSKVQLDGFKPAWHEMDIKRTTEDVIGSVESMAELKGIKIIYRPEATPPVRTDSEVFKLVLRNFLTNAIKFSFRAASVTVTVAVQNSSLVISVTDTGTGIENENLAKLFAFKNFSTTGTQAEKGSGIGLVITKEFVEMMNGNIDVQSELGKGSTFSATLPLTQSPTRFR